MYVPAVRTAVSRHGLLWRLDIHEGQGEHCDLSWALFQEGGEGVLEGAGCYIKSAQVHHGLLDDGKEA